MSLPEWVRVGAEVRCTEAFYVLASTVERLVPVGTKSRVVSVRDGAVTLYVPDGNKGDLMTRRPATDFLHHWEHVPSPPPRPRPKRPMILKTHPSFPDFSGEGEHNWPKGFIGYWAYTADPSKDAYEKGRPLCSSRGRKTTWTCPGTPRKEPRWSTTSERLLPTCTSWGSLGAVFVGGLSEPPTGMTAHTAGRMSSTII